MKHTISDDLNINLNVEVEVPSDEIGDVVDKIVDGAVTIIIVWTGAQILKSIFNPN